MKMKVGAYNEIKLFSRRVDDDNDRDGTLFVESQVASGSTSNTNVAAAIVLLVLISMLFINLN